MRRRRYLALTGAAFSVGLAGCSSEEEPQEVPDDQDTPEGGTTDSDAGSNNTTREEATEAQTQAEAESKDVSAAVGELVEGNQMSLVVENFERGVDLGEFYEPDSGNEFAVASIALKNTGADYTSVSNLLQLRLRDNEDYQYEQTFASGDAPTFNAGQFAPGEVERGIVPFEIPQDAAGLALVFDFDVSLFGGVDRATIDLGRQADSVHQLRQELQIEMYGAGDTVEYSGVQVTVNEFRTESSLGQFTEPDDGNEYCIVDISITNNTGEAKQFSTLLQMMIKDGAGYTYQESLSATSQLDRAFDEGTPLSDGETRRGELAYELAEGRSPLYWVFEFDLFASGNKTFWQLR